MPPTGLTWEGFWVPNLISWGGQVVLVAGVGTLVGWLVRRWLNATVDQQSDNIERTKTASYTAADRAGAAVEQTQWLKAHIEPLIVNRLELENRVHAIEQYMADHELNQHETDQAVITGSRFLDQPRSRRTHDQHP